MNNCALACELDVSTEADPRDEGDAYPARPVPQVRSRIRTYELLAAAAGTTVESEPSVCVPHDLEDFEKLATEQPVGLAVLLMEGGLSLAQLTFAAEALGDMEDTTLALRLLRPLARHESPLVREGAIYGLRQIGGNEARELLQEIAVADAAQGLRPLAGGF